MARPLKNLVFSQRGLKKKDKDRQREFSVDAALAAALSKLDGNFRKMEEELLCF